MWYQRIPSHDDLSLPPYHTPSKSFTWKSIRFNKRHIILLTLITLVPAISFLALSERHRGLRASVLGTELFPPNSFNFDQSSQPSWLQNNTSTQPLVLRVAIITRADEFERRQVLRETMLRGVPSREVKFEHAFFVGRSTGLWSQIRSVEKRMKEENEKHGDLQIQHDLEDTSQLLSVKRYRALQWAGSQPRETYDWFLNLDGDTFLRFAALARRIPYLFGGNPPSPREQPILMAQLYPHSNYYINTVANDNDTPQYDLKLSGPSYDYPIGVGYLTSSSLVSTFLSTDPPLPHHINYPYDDVMIGSWIASLRNFPSHPTSFNYWQTQDPYTPKPYFKEPVEVMLKGDNEGWHDFPGRGWLPPKKGKDIGWESVAIHKPTLAEMRALREMEQFKGEWEDERRM